ncbi:transcriptional regulator with XRE-family HTH domain [Streptomyces sp. B4I13]|uniref:helix-turn-helix domain-containing protein n=1 Tax=Streptomyces sp. B4I13 TaxID=3042271 RepID=UPI00277DE558|nr:helix-turn-helix transcriptional regulator [Streptomyces sp. B4I13]MDQ0959419.1 transcriptional regulator with XRE-family HTH domain [Streptomyces sp. B4I13]
MNQAELGAAMRALRQASGKEAKAVARSAVMSTAKLSKIENGRVAPATADVERILTALDVSPEIKAEYLAVARAQATEATAWRLFRRMGYHKKQEQIRALESSMTLLRLFQPSLVPGLLQTPEYIRSVLEPKSLTDEQLSRTVSARIERQRVLYDTSKVLHFVVTEPVLRWRLLPPAMMAGQLDRIVSVSRLPNVDVRVVPLDAPQRDVPGHSFVIRDDRVVTVETTHAEVVVTDPQDVSLYVEKFDRFASVSLAGDAMRDLVEGIRDAFLRERETP